MEHTLGLIVRRIWITRGYSLTTILGDANTLLTVVLDGVAKS